jgi:hypothetical protein
MALRSAPSGLADSLGPHLVPAHGDGLSPSSATSLLRLPGGRTVAYTENAYRGELIEADEPVERLQRAYDAVRDLALPPAESRKFILRMLEEVPCDPST